MKARLSSLYVVINTSRLAEWGRDGEFSVMPGDNPHTYTSLESAVECQAQLALESGHTIDSVPVYRLAVVPDEEVQPLFEKALLGLKEELKDMEEWDG